MSEKLQFVPKKVTTLKKVLNMVWFILACLTIFGATVIHPVIFMVPAIGFTILWVFQQFRSNIEYEYTYYDGELRFARIKNKAKRKRIAVVNMDDVLAFAPKGDRSVYKYENDRNMPYKDLTSGNPDAKVYELVWKAEKAVTRFEIEPDDEILDAIAVKYARLVVR